MTGAEYVELAKAYVALSNAHRPELIGRLLASTASYSSTTVGDYRGPDAIVAMMEGFFQLYPDAHWQVDEYQPTGSSVVAFDFRLTATHAESGHRLDRTGHELIRFNGRGEILRVEVMA